MRKFIGIFVVLFFFTFCTSLREAFFCYEPNRNIVSQDSNGGILELEIFVEDSIAFADFKALQVTILIQNLSSNDLLLPALLNDIGYPYFLCEVIRKGDRTICTNIPPDVDYRGRGLPTDYTYFIKGKSTEKLEVEIACKEVFQSGGILFERGTYYVKFYISNNYPAHNKKFPMWVGYVESNEVGVVIY